MSLIAEFSVHSTGLALAEVTEQVPSVTVELTNMIGTDPHRPVLFFWVDGGDLSAFDEAVQSDWSVTDVELYTDLGDRRLYRAKLSPDVDLVSYPVWVEAGASRLASTCQGGSWTNRMRFPDRESFEEVKVWCVDNDIEFTLHALYRETDNGHGPGQSGLSPQQRRTLAHAYQAGYYEIPRRATAEEIATDLGISQQAVSERLRRAYAALIEAHVLRSE